MYWIPVFAIPMAIALTKLGALSVWVDVLSAALVGVAVISGVGAAALIARFLMRRLRQV